MWSLSRSQASPKIDLCRPLGMIDERITISLSLEDRLVAMSLVVIHREVPVPFEECGEAIFRILFRCAVDLPWVPQEKIQRRPRDRPFPATRFKLMCFPFAALISDDFFKVSEVEIGCISSETVAARFTGKEMMQVAAHRLRFSEPGLRNDVFAIER